MQQWILVISFLILLSSVAFGQVPVPHDCVQLALREGFPTDTLTKSQVARARYRMARMNNNDPLVRLCREAIAALKAQQGDTR